MKMNFYSIAFAMLFPIVSYATEAGVNKDTPLCTPTTHEGEVCKIHDLSQIHAAQFNYGEQYVNGWANKYKNTSPTEYQKILDNHVFPIVISPDQKIYLTDGHHRLT